MDKSNDTRLTFDDIGCLVKVGLIALLVVGLLFLYLQHAYSLLKPNAENSAKWNDSGITSYLITVNSNSMRANQGANQVTVRDGRAVSGTSDMCPKCDLSTFQAYTVGSLFGRVWTCVLFYPLLKCSVTYDAQYGYPSEIKTDCPPIPDACYEDLSVNEVKAIP